MSGMVDGEYSQCPGEAEETDVSHGYTCIVELFDSPGGRLGWFCYFHQYDGECGDVHDEGEWDGEDDAEIEGEAVHKTPEKKKQA